jgi:hypothetical protein
MVRGRSWLRRRLVRLLGRRGPGLRAQDPGELSTSFLGGVLAGEGVEASHGGVPVGVGDTAWVLVLAGVEGVQFLAHGVGVFGRLGAAVVEEPGREPGFELGGVVGEGLADLLMECGDGGGVGFDACLPAGLDVGVAVLDGGVRAGDRGDLARLEGGAGLLLAQAANWSASWSVTLVGSRLMRV